MADDFKRGDTVEIIDTGNTYSSYESWAEQYNLNLFENRKSISENAICKIVVVARHFSNPETFLYGVLYEGFHYIVGDRAIRKVTAVKEDKGENLIGRQFYRGGTCLYTFSRFDEVFKKLHFFYNSADNSCPNSADVSYCRKKIKNGDWTLKKLKNSSKSHNHDSENSQITVVDQKSTVVISECSTTNKEETTMKNENTIEIVVSAAPYAETTVVTMYGAEVHKYSELQLFNLLSRVEEEQMHLKQINKTAKSSRVAGKINSLGLARNKVVAMIDALPAE